MLWVFVDRIRTLDDVHEISYEDDSLLDVSAEVAIDNSNNNLT